MTGIVWGALAAHLLVVSLGLLLLFPLRLRLTPGERWAAAVVCGLPVSIVLVQALASGGLFRRGVLQALALLAALAAAWLYRRRGSPLPDGRASENPSAVSEPRPSVSEPRPSGSGAPRVWLLILPLWAWTAFSAAQPDFTPPGEDWALTAAHRFVAGFAAAPWDFGAAYATPYLLGRHSAVALFHASLILALAAALGRFGWVAMVLVAAHPALLALGSHAGTAVAFALSAFAAVGLVALSFLQRSLRPILPAAPAAIAAWLSWPGPVDVFTGFVFLKSPWWLAPFLAVALGWLVLPSRWSAAALAAFAVLTGWPPATALLAPPRPHSEFPSGMVEARLLDILPRGAVVLTDIAMPGAWVPRSLAFKPEWLDEARRVADARWGVRTSPFSGSPMTADLPGFIGEVQVLADGREIPRTPNWRVWPPEAFDGLPFTGAAGPVRIDPAVPLEHGELRVIGVDGAAWTPPAGLRRNVVLEWKRRGITHVLVRDVPLVGEFSLHSAYWGIQEIAERNQARLYELR